jgi:anthranilate/para-aminobenzoate synthase component II
MENKILPDIKTSIERPTDGLSIQFISEVSGAEVLSTQASFHGEIVISAERRQAFLTALSQLVDDFRVY